MSTVVGMLQAAARRTRQHTMHDFADAVPNGRLDPAGREAARLLSRIAS